MSRAWEDVVEQLEDRIAALRGDQPSWVWVGPRTWVEPKEDADRLLVDLGLRAPSMWFPVDREDAGRLLSSLLSGSEAPAGAPAAAEDLATEFVAQFEPEARFLTTGPQGAAVVGIDDVTIGVVCVAEAA